MMVDGLRRIYNAMRNGDVTVMVIKTNFMRSILDLLSKEGYIQGYKISEEHPTRIKVYLNRNKYNLTFKIYRNGGYKKYVSYKEVRRLYSRRRCVSVITTSKGLYTVSDIVNGDLGVGGELLFDILLESKGHGR